MGTTLGPAEIVVDLAAIRANARLLRETAGVPLIAVVKADGYGHGMVESARAAREGGRAYRHVGGAAHLPGVQAVRGARLGELVGVTGPEASTGVGGA